MVIGTRTSVPSRSAGTDRGRKRFCYVVKPPRGRQFREVHLAWIAIGRLRLNTLCLHYSRQVLVLYRKRPGEIGVGSRRDVGAGALLIQRLEGSRRFGRAIALWVLNQNTTQCVDFVSGG